MEWKQRLQGTENKEVDDLPNHGPEWTDKMEHWLASVRLDGLQLSSKPGKHPGLHTYWGGAPSSGLHTEICTEVGEGHMEVGRACSLVVWGHAS